MDLRVINIKDSNGDGFLHCIYWDRPYAADKMVELALSVGIDVNARGCGGRTPLHHAALGPDSVENAFKRLLDAGADVNARDRHGSTPLHLVAGEGRVNEAWNRTVTSTYAEILIKYGADVFARDGGGKTPRMIAEGHPRLCPRESIEWPGWVNFFRNAETTAGKH